MKEGKPQEGLVKKHIYFILFIVCLFLLVSFTKQKPEWKGKIEAKDGVIIVKNPKEPMYDENIFALKEDLSIGAAEGREDYMFSLIVSIDIDEKGNIYVLDVKEAQLKVFNREGRLIRIIGRMGQGPGELQNPYTVQIAAQNEIVIWDPIPRRFLFFSPEGEYKKSISTTNLFNPPILDDEGNIVSLVIIDEGEGHRYELQRLDSELNPLTFYISYLRPELAGYNPFRSTLQWALTNKNEIVCGHPDEGYDIKIFNPEGKVIRNIVKDYAPVMITQEEIKRAKVPPESLRSIPKFHSAFRWIVIDEDNRIFVCSWERPENILGRYIDVFSPEGKFIVKIPLEYEMLMGAPIVFKGRNLYLVKTDEDGYQYVKRYKVTLNY